MAKITNEMATNLSLDVSNAKKSLKDLTQEVKNSNNEWKIQENQLKAAGDSANASKARYEGLSSTVDKQREKVTALKGALENTNTSTEKGQKLQSYLTQELAKAERQLNSYQGQLDKATQSYKYQSSGLAKLNDDIKHSNDLTDARVRKLEAEGRTEEAQKARLEQLHSVRVNYNKILDVQKSELNKLAEAGDKNSSSYKKQELRVAEMSAKIAETTSKIKELNHQGIHIDTGKLANLREQLNKTNELLNKTNHHFRNIFLGNVAANAFTNTLTSVQTHLSDMVRSANDYNKEQQVMNATWTTLTDSADKGKDMVKSINNMSTAFGQSSDVVNELDQQFYHVFNQKEPTEQLTKSMLTMADTLGMNNEEVQRLGLNFTHMMTSSKMQLGDFNMITDQLPMYGEKLLEYEKEVQHNSQLTMAELRKQMSDGKISAEDATKVMNELGDKYKDASENMMGTFTGMQRRIKSQSKMLIGSLTEPILNTKNPLFESVSKWVADERTVKEFDKLGKQISKSFNVVSQAFSSQFKSKDFTDFANSAMETATKKIEQFGNYIANHAKEITDFFKMIKDLGSAGFGTLGLTLKIALPLLEVLGSFASKHPTEFKILAGSIFGINLAVKALTTTLLGFEKAKSILSFGKGLFIKPKVDGSSAKRELTLIGKAAKGIGKSFVWVGKLVWSGIKKAIGGIKLAAKGVGKAFSWTAKIATKGAQLALKGLLTTAKVVGNGIKLAFNFAKSNPLFLFISVITAVGIALFELYKHNAKFKKFVDGIFKSIGKLGKDIGKWATKLFKDISKWFGDVGKSIGKAVKTISKPFEQGWKVLSDVVQTVFKFIGKFISAEIKGWQIIISTAIKIITTIWKVGWEVISTVFKAIWDGIKAVFEPIIKWLSDTITSTVHNIQKTWENIWNSISSFFGGIWKWITKTGSDAINGIHDTISGVLDSIGKVWNNMWRSFSDFFGSIWKDIKGFAQDGINGVLSIINAGVDAIDNVWKFFTGHETSIHHLAPVKFERGGIVKTRMSMINDGKGENWKELIQLPDGRLKMSNKRDHVLPLPVGTRIYNGEQTKQIMNAAGVTKYASGGIVGDVIDWGKGAFNDVSSWIGDKFEAVTNFLKDPLKNVVNMITKATDGMYSGLHNFGDMAHGVWDNLYNPIADWFKKGLEEVKKSMSRSAPGGAGVERWR
ncbi:tape measure protein, partial [Convivina intestini]|uniref:tape measure protein n=1 Tax=Convivina intestini TaxID=1505726 RepID=UPI00200F89FD